MKRQFVIIVALIIYLPFLSYAYDDTKVHPAINTNATEQSILITEDLLNKLGFERGLDTEIQGPDNERKKIINWIEKGGTDEDNPLISLRFAHHFHDPLKSWDEAGLDIPLLPTTESSISWAQTPTNAINFKNDYSWPWARQYFYQALATGKEEGFAITFAMLGHLMHLVSDMAVPAHVRNDSHPFSIPFPQTWKTDPFEIWAALDENWNSLNYSGVKVDPSIFSRGVTTFQAPVQITALWDQNVYNGSNPQMTVNAQGNALFTSVGLAEYTNANFFSKNSINDDYAYPEAGLDTWFVVDWGTPEKVIAEDNTEDNRIYLYGYAGGTDNIRLAGASIISRDTVKRNAPPKWMLDDKIHEDYASRLIPAAVGYSTALLDYFFRGDIEISAPDRYVYGIIDDASFFDADGIRTGEQYFTEIRAKIRNNSQLGLDEFDNPIIEAMGAGTLVAVAKYKRRTDYQPDLFNEPPDEYSREANFSYSVSAPVPITSLTSVEAEEKIFDFSASPIPVGITDLYLQVVFKGTLGNERENAVAVGMVDLNEPMVFRLSNNTDKYYYNQTLTSLSDYPHGAPERDLFNYSVSGRIGFFPVNGIFTHYALNYAIEPGMYSKIIFLSEGSEIGVRAEETRSTSEISYVSVVNQDLSFTIAQLWRGSYAHQGFHWYVYNPDMDGFWTASWPDFIKAKPVPVTITP
ncbi:MAG: hypothetical protein KKE17_10975 [Proteobacteria bacterium]|nr:hypothetical protein [Pseudomonadota bacterium]MBU1710515.1 hypothetical protein [Pseudomonadota bacterium]